MGQFGRTPVKGGPQNLQKGASKGVIKKNYLERFLYKLWYLDLNCTGIGPKSVFYP